MIRPTALQFKAVLAKEWDDGQAPEYAANVELCFETTEGTPFVVMLPAVAAVAAGHGLVRAAQAALTAKQAAIEAGRSLEAGDDAVGRLFEKFVEFTPEEGW